jgi:deazaflavin-dependent oxidoreductase (nitroreductase family)
VNSSRTLTRWSNRFGVWLYRRSDGRLGGPGKGTTIALLTVPGRTTGLPRTVAIGLHTDKATYLAVGTGSGSRHEPDWFRNLRATPLADLQIKAARLRVNVRVTSREERDRLWHEVVLAQAAWREKYERTAGRTIPVAVLTPVDGSGPDPR